MSHSHGSSESFWPPFCPNSTCVQATRAHKTGFFRHGHYTAQIHGQPIPRFLCSVCRRTMSSQTFDATYRLRMPELEGAIIREIQHGSSLRRVADILGINRKTVSRRLDRARRQDVRWVSRPLEGHGDRAVRNPRHRV